MSDKKVYKFEGEKGDASWDGEAAETAPDANTVMVSNNGPLCVSGELEVDGAAEDMPGVRSRAALCRCGDSKNKPFCDNTHEDSGFKDHGAVGETGSGFDAPGGKLAIKRAPDGPLLLNGNFAILSGSGRVSWRGTKAALCRCGQSKNKPFCDGAHKAAGFKAD
jgi:CDGSH-type Zn-finger protein